MTHKPIKQAVLIVAIANLIYFFIEFFGALNIHSVSLFADSIDFLEDSLVNFLIFFAIGWSVVTRSKVGMVLAGFIIIPALTTIWAVYHQLTGGQPPKPADMSLIAFGALLVNSCCALLLAKHRHHDSSIIRAAFLSARNDAAANIAIILTGIFTAIYPSIWPDIIVGLGIAMMNVDAAKEVYQAARNEKIKAKA